VYEKRYVYLRDRQEIKVSVDYPLQLVNILTNSRGAISMDKEDFSRDYRERQKGIWFKFVESYLKESSDEFLRRFSKFIKEGYEDSENTEFKFNEPVGATSHQTMLKDAFDFDVLRLPSMQNKGFAFIGKTSFDKLDFIKNYFAVCGLSEFTGDEVEGRYAVVNCSELKGYNSLVKALVKNQDVAYVIFDNCDSLLKHDGALQAFKQLSEDNIGLTFITKNDETVNFKTDSAFVFLGEENTLHIAVEKQNLKGLGASAYNHFDSFIHHIHVYDFDKGERYYGHDVAMIHN
jgi:hypothetical protein